MKYYVVADIHSFYEPLVTALEEKGFFSDKEPHKLIVCGDLFDRGSDALAIQDFIIELLERNQLILIRGNHEDLMFNLLTNWDEHSYLFSHHISNGTIGTALQLTQSSEDDLRVQPKTILQKMYDTPFLKKIYPALRDYYETEHYIFVHGWIPCRLFRTSSAAFRYESIVDWRNASAYDWNISRWTNGMEAGITELLMNVRQSYADTGTVLLDIVDMRAREANSVKMQIIHHISKKALLPLMRVRLYRKE